MGITINVSPEIAPAIASAYQNPSRVFMEYIDNSLDSAAPLFDDKAQKYSRLVQITVSIDSKNKTVTFEDNCLGMDESNLLRIVQNIGKSSKKNDFLTNGQFGFGIHSYLACAENMEVTTSSYESNKPLRIKIDRSQYTAGGTIDDLVTLFKNPFPEESGTTVKLSNFDAKWWKDVSLEVLQAEVERHFEQLLVSENLDIKIYFDNSEIICKHFNYNDYEGYLVDYDITEIEKGNKKYQLASPLKVYLKVTDDIISDKRPIFMSKGRRIEEIQAIKSFRTISVYKTGLWRHDNLTGYIEVGDLLDPIISRDDFKRNKNRSLVYEAIKQIEPDIHEKLQAINKRSEDANLSKLEAALNPILAKLARQDNLRFREILQPGGGEDGVIMGGAGLEDIGSISDGGNSSGGKAESNGQADKTSIAETDDEAELNGRHRKSGGFNIEFASNEQKKSDGTFVRSLYIEGSAIVIFKNHPDFERRLKRTNQGEVKLTDRLLSYLASEISIHYKDKFFAKHGKQPEVQKIINSRKELFTEIFEFQYILEEALQPLAGKNINTLEDMIEE